MRTEHLNTHISDPKHIRGKDASLLRLQSLTPVVGLGSHVTEEAGPEQEWGQDVSKLQKFHPDISRSRSNPSLSQACMSQPVPHTLALLRRPCILAARLTGLSPYKVLWAAPGIPLHANKAFPEYWSWPVMYTRKPMGLAAPQRIK